jgi:hypothetical protein
LRTEFHIGGLYFWPEKKFVYILSLTSNLTYTLVNLKNGGIFCQSAEYEEILNRLQGLQYIGDCSQLDLESFLVEKKLI